MPLTRKYESLPLGFRDGPALSGSYSAFDCVFIGSGPSPSGSVCFSFILFLLVPVSFHPLAASRTLHLGLISPSHRWPSIAAVGKPTPVDMEPWRVGFYRQRRSVLSAVDSENWKRPITIEMPPWNSIGRVQGRVVAPGTRTTVCRFRKKNEKENATTHGNRRRRIRTSCRHVTDGTSKRGGSRPQRRSSTSTHRGRPDFTVVFPTSNTGVFSSLSDFFLHPTHGICFVWESLAYY